MKLPTVSLCAKKYVNVAHSTKWVWQPWRTRYQDRNIKGKDSFAMFVRDALIDS